MVTAHAASQWTDRAIALGYADILEATESPVEALLAAVWLSRYGSQNLTVQRRIGAYRTDMAIGDGSRRIAVEVDGYDFHEITSRQQAHDRRRERYLQRQGWLVVRFAGSEIWADPGVCVDELAEFLWGEAASTLMAVLAEIAARHAEQQPEMEGA